jgi:hypothetical protein
LKIAVKHLMKFVEVLFMSFESLDNNIIRVQFQVQITNKDIIILLYINLITVFVCYI